MIEFTEDHILQLNDTDLRILVLKLCEAEASARSLPISGISAGGNQTAADGGIDVRVDFGSLNPANIDFIKRAHTGFQVKCSDMPAAKIKAEMRPGGVLRPVIEELANANGAYILVVSKGSFADGPLKNRLEAMRAALADLPNRDSLYVDFYDRGKLAQWVQSYPGVEMWARDRIAQTLHGWRAHGPWSRGEPTTAYHYDNSGIVFRKFSNENSPMSAADCIDALRRLLAKPGGVARIVGLSGVGKNRLAQALFEPSYGALTPLDSAAAIYGDLGSMLEPAAREMLHRLGIIGKKSIVIIDNCNPATHTALSEIVRKFSSFLSLLTIEYDVVDDSEDEESHVFELKPSSDLVASEILIDRAPYLTEVERYRIIEFSSGNSQVALTLAQSFKKGKSIGVLTDAQLFDRIFLQGRPNDQEVYKAAEACSLVYSFDKLDLDSELSEMRILASVNGLTPIQLSRCVSKLERRDLVQARSNWRAFLPHALANRMAKKVLEEIPGDYLLEHFRKTDRLFKSFCRRLGYLHDCDNARHIAEKWIGNGNWLANLTASNSTQLSAFFNISPLAPAKALSAIEESLSFGDDAYKKHSGFMTREWVSLIRKIGYEAKYFERAADLVLIYVERESDGWTNAKAAWVEFFHVELSGTLAPPHQRAAYLSKLFKNSSAKVRGLAVDGVGAMLEVSQIIATYDTAFGAHPRTSGWAPKSQDELVQWYEIALNLAQDAFLSGGDVRRKICEILAGKFRELWHLGFTQKKISSMFTSMAHEADWLGGWVAAKLSLCLDAKNISSEERENLKALSNSLAPNTLRSKILAYVISHGGGALDIADVGDDDCNSSEIFSPSNWDLANERAFELGVESSNNEPILLSVLPNAFLENGERLFEFGRGIGSGCKQPHDMWGKIGGAYVNQPGLDKNWRVLAGFFDGLRSRSDGSFDEILDKLVDDSAFFDIFPGLQGRVTDDAGVARLEKCLSLHKAPAMLFNVKCQIDGGEGLLPDIFADTLRKILPMHGGLSAVARTLIFTIGQFKEKKINTPLCIAEICCELMLEYDYESHDQLMGHYLYKIAHQASVLPKFPEVLPAFLEKLANSILDYKKYTHTLGELVRFLFETYPSASLSGFLLSGSDWKKSSYRVQFTLHREYIIQYATDDDILIWVREDVANRAHLVAAEVEVLTAGEDGLQWSNLVKELLELTKNEGLILEALAWRLNPSAWFGSVEETLHPILVFVEKLAEGSEDLSGWATQNAHQIKSRISSQTKAIQSEEQSFE